MITLTSSVHILSFAILGAASLVVWAVFYALSLTTGLTLAKLAAYTLPASLIFFIPDGPYAAMIQDIKTNHLQSSLHGQRVWMEIVALAAFLALLFGLIRRYARLLASFVLRRLVDHPIPAWIGVCILAASALVTQAWILPAQAWTPYGNSTTLFLASQLGNLFFIGLFALGLEFARKTYSQGLDTAHMQMSFILLISVSIVAAVALAASFGMLHTNWMLRILNYFCLFMAPFAAIGFNNLKWVRGKWCIWLLMLSLSFTAVVRPSALFDC